MLHVVQDLLVVGVGGIVCYVVWRIFKHVRAIMRLPPGPTGLPFLGIANQLDPTKQVQTMLEYKEKYGDIFSFTLPSQYVVVISSYELIKEVLLNRSDEFAGRPQSFRIQALMDFHPVLGFSSDSPKIRVLKKTLGTSLKMYGERLLKLEDLTLAALSDLIDDWRSKKGRPIDPQNALHDVTVSIISSLAFGQPLNEEESAQNLAMQLSIVTRVQPGGPGQILELMPWLRHFGLGSWEGLQKDRKLVKSFVEPLISKCKERYNEANPECVFDALTAVQPKVIQEHGPDKMTDIDIQNQVLQLLGAGTATTFRATHSFVAIMVNKPDIQKRLQRVIDDTIGTRQPRLADKEKMPLVEATIYELLRYISHSPFLVPHCTTQDTTLAGYHLPKGTQVWNFVFSMQHDPRYWDEPWEFRPERYLDQNGKLVTPDHMNRRRLLQFGAGRRACAGEVLAKNRLFLMLTSLLQNFTFRPVSERERPSSDPRTYRAGLAIHPHDYKIYAEPR